MLYVSVHVLYSGYFVNDGGGDAVAPGGGFVVAVQNQNIVPRLGVFLYMVGDSTKIERFSEILSSKYGSTPPRLLVFIGSEC